MPKPEPIPSIAELRRVCHDPVRQFNDLTGSLYGWRISIHLTRAFLGLGLSASFASTAMVVCGLLGSALCLFGGWFLTAGLALLVVTYILDCVDGEMARYYGIDSFRWAGVDYVHHLLTKGLAFPCLGIGFFVAYGNPWTMAIGGLCAACWLILVGVRDLPLVLFAKKIVANEGRDQNPAFRRLVRNLHDLRRAANEEREKVEDVWGADFRFQPWMIRTFFTAFDIVVPLLCLASFADRFGSTFSMFGHTFSYASALLLGYGLLLPLHTADVIHTAMSRGQIRDELYELARKAEDYGRHDLAAHETHDDPAQPSSHSEPQEQVDVVSGRGIPRS